MQHSSNLERMLETNIFYRTEVSLYFLPGGNGELEPPDLVPNSEVTRLIADGSAGFPRARVGHRRAFFKALVMRLFFLDHEGSRAVDLTSIACGRLSFGWWGALAFSSDGGRFMLTKHYKLVLLVVASFLYGGMPTEKFGY